MKDQKSAYYAKADGQISDQELLQAVQASLASWPDLKRVLIIPPDITRLHSLAGKITSIYYSLLQGSCQVDIMPAIGTHDPMTEAETKAFFGNLIPYDKFIKHNWRHDIVKIGEVPASYVASISEGLIAEPVEIEINRRILDPSYDLIISVGQVLPHEVVGMANYSKNIFVGCGGINTINKSHMLGAVYGMERLLGRDHSPVRKIFDYAEANFISGLPLIYVLTVTCAVDNNVELKGLFIGRKRKVFEQAVKLSQQVNFNPVESPLEKIIVYLDEQEFKSTWLGNKAIYRTRMALDDGGELIIIAPGIRKFGEDAQNDQLIRKYGYRGRNQTLRLYGENADLRENSSVAAHLIHGSSDGRFKISYAARHLSKAQIESVGYSYLDYEQTLATYNVKELKDGFNTINGERIYYISNPAVGLWACIGNLL